MRHYYSEVDSFWNKGTEPFNLKFFPSDDKSSVLFYEDKSIGLIVCGECRLIIDENKKEKLELGEYIANLYLQDGVNFCNQLKGEFSFGVIDNLNHRVVLYRDRFGTIPLFYSKNNEKLLFSTSISSLENNLSELSINTKVAIDFLNYSYQVSTNTIFNEINRLMPSSFIEFSSNEEPKQKHYSYVSKNISSEIDVLKERNLAEELRNELIRSTSIKLGKTDKVGIMLSGGLDSSVVASSLRSIGVKEITSLSITYEHIDEANIDKIDESFYQDLINKSLGLKQIKITSREINHFLLAKDNLDLFGEPVLFPNFYIFDLIYQKANEIGLKKVFDGHDGDTVISHGFEYLKELFFKFKWISLLKVIKEFADLKNKTFLHSLKRFTVLGIKDLIRFQKKGRRITKAKNQYTYIPFFSEHHIKVTHPYIGIANEQGYAVSKKHKIKRRSPFFTEELVDLCLALPSELKFGSGINREILRHAFSNDLPNQITNRIDKADLSHNLLLKSSREDMSVIYDELNSIDNRLLDLIDESSLNQEVERYFSNEKDMEGYLLILSFVILNGWLSKRRNYAFSKKKLANLPFNKE